MLQILPGSTLSHPNPSCAGWPQLRWLASLAASLVLKHACTGPGTCGWFPPPLTPFPLPDLPVLKICLHPSPAPQSASSPFAAQTPWRHMASLLFCLWSFSPASWLPPQAVTLLLSPQCRHTSWSTNWHRDQALCQ